MEDEHMFRSGVAGRAKMLLALGLVVVAAAGLTRSSPGRASETRLSRPSTLTITQAGFHEAAQKGKPLGLVFAVDGQLDEAAKSVDLFLARTAPGPRICCWGWRVRDHAAGAFHDSLPAYWLAQLGYPLTAGTYELTINESPAAGGLVQSPAPKAAALAPGREGLIRHAWLSATQKGPEVPVTSRDPRGFVQAKVVGQARQMWAHFFFDVAPKLRPLQATWYARGRIAGSTQARLVKNRVDVVVFMKTQKPLVLGLWRVVLQAGRIPVGELRIRLTR
jgi:hypothetical protein